MILRAGSCFHARPVPPGAGWSSRCCAHVPPGAVGSVSKSNSSRRASAQPTPPVASSRTLRTHSDREAPAFSTRLRQGRTPGTGSSSWKPSVSLRRRTTLSPGQASRGGGAATGVSYRACGHQTEQAWGVRCARRPGHESRRPPATGGSIEAAIIASIPGLVCVIDADRRIVLFNRRSRACHRLAAGEMLGRPLLRVLAAPHEAALGHDAITRSPMPGGHAEQLPGRRGRAPRPHRVRWRRHGVCVGADVTDRRRLEWAGDSSPSCPRSSTAPDHPRSARCRPRTEQPAVRRARAAVGPARWRHPRGADRPSAPAGRRSAR